MFHVYPNVSRFIQFVLGLPKGFPVDPKVLGFTKRFRMIQRINVSPRDQCVSKSILSIHKIVV